MTEWGLLCAMDFIARIEASEVLAFATQAATTLKPNRTTTSRYKLE